MTHHVPLPPQLERFVREQLAVGRYRSEDDLVRAAVRLLAEQQPPAGPNPTPPRNPRSPRGLLADLRSGLGPDDFAEARRGAWADFSRGDAG